MLSNPESATSEQIRVGIVGSGVAGSTGAHFAREALGPGARIVVFERNGQVGGRVQEIEVEGLQVETGASLIHSANRHLTTLIDRLGLHRANEHAEEFAPGTKGVPPYGIWNGRSFPLVASSSSWITRARMALRYGFSLRTVARLGGEMVERLGRVYDLQDSGRAFVSPEELFRSLGLYEMTQQTSYDTFQQHGISQRFVREFANGVSRSNYGQDASINAFVNLVSLATAGFSGGTLFSVAEGNNQLCQGALRIANAEVRTNYGIRRIVREPSADSSWSQLTVIDESGHRETFDAVIVAAPLEEAGIDFQNIDVPEAATCMRQYQVTYRTLVVGHLNPGYFGMRTLQDVPRAVLTMELPEIPFSSLHLVGKTPDGQSIYSMFTRQEPEEALLASLFGQQRQTLQFRWLAYPVLTPTPDWPPFRLSQGLFYVNAMESPVSTMETEAIGSRNVVNLLVQDLRNQGR